MMVIALVLLRVSGRKQPYTQAAPRLGKQNTAVL